jgi:cytochrome c biogenesis protein
MGKGIFTDFLNKFWNFFTSVRLTVIVLISIAITSIVGTIVPQNQTPATHLLRWSDFFYEIFDAIGIFDIYHSGWFRFLLFILTLNIIVCSINRLSSTWKTIFGKISSMDISKFRRLSDREQFNINSSPDHLKKTYESAVSINYNYLRTEQTDSGFCIFAEKGRWTRLGVYMVHFSVVLLLFGGILGSIFGFEGSVNIAEGQKTSTIRLNNTSKLYHLDFEIRCDDFNVIFYNSGTPKEYRSKLTIFEHDVPVLKKDILVNSPLRYKGINIFQAGYGLLPPNEITLNFKNRETGKEYHTNVNIGQPFDLPDDMGQFVISNFKTTVSFNGHNLGDCLVGTLTPDNGNAVDIILPLQFPNFDKMRRGTMVVTLVNYGYRYFTGLQITSDPGVPIVYTGFLVMIIGCFITFFMSHQRLCIEVIGRGNYSKVVIKGAANKNKIRMQNGIERLSKNMVNLL